MYASAIALIKEPSTFIAAAHVLIWSYNSCAPFPVAMASATAMAKSDQSISQLEDPASERLVHTLGISSTGAKIGSLRENIQPGSVLLLQHGRNRAQCRVIWSLRVGPAEIQMGVEFLTHSARFWELDFEEGRAAVWLSPSQR
jgi:hypothetical protein